MAKIGVNDPLWLKGLKSGDISRVKIVRPKTLILRPISYYDCSHPDGYVAKTGLEGPQG